MLRQQVIHLYEVAGDDTFLQEHLVAELNQALGRLRRLKVEKRDGTLHPMSENPIFETVDDGMGFKLGRRKDFLERNGPPVARRL